MLAVIHDAIVVPVDPASEPEQISLLKAEMIRALQFAACSMGFDHYVDVPDGDVAALKEKALQIQRDHDKLPIQTPVAAG